MSTWETTKSRHGTPSGARLHAMLKERPCDPCYEAKARYDRERLTQPATKLRNRAHAKAQQRALQALARKYPDEYRTLYVAFKAEVLA